MASVTHLVKLCVGCDSPEELQHWQAQRYGDAPASHVTRMWPKREAEILSGGSLYWVFKGVILARQRLIALEERMGEGGICRCALMLDRDLVLVAAAPRRPFQGWRYLDPADAPPDLPSGRATEDSLPAGLAAELASLGLR